MEFKHTKGPWEYIPNDTVSSQTISSVWVKNTSENYRLATIFGTNSTESEANAKLIAAAPELLEALEYMIRCNEKEYMKCEIPDALQKAKEAIKKATE